MYAVRCSGITAYEPYWRCPAVCAVGWGDLSLDEALAPLAHTSAGGDRVVDLLLPATGDVDPSALLDVLASTMRVAREQLALLADVPRMVEPIWLSFGTATWAGVETNRFGDRTPSAIPFIDEVLDDPAPPRPCDHAEPRGGGRPPKGQASVKDILESREAEAARAFLDRLLVTACGDDPEVIHGPWGRPEHRSRRWARERLPALRARVPPSILTEDVIAVLDSLRPSDVNEGLDHVAWARRVDWYWTLEREIKPALTKQLLAVVALAYEIPVQARDLAAYWADRLREARSGDRRVHGA